MTADDDRSDVTRCSGCGYATTRLRLKSTRTGSWVALCEPCDGVGVMDIESRSMRALVAAIIYAAHMIDKRGGKDG